MNLQPYPEYKDSGVEWLGEIPEHWALNRLAVAVSSSINGVWGDEPGGVRDIRCVRVADFDRSQQRIDDRDVTFRSVSEIDQKVRGLRSGDLLLEKSGGGEKSPVGFVVLYDRLTPAVCSNFVSRVRLHPGMEPRFWTFVHGFFYDSRLTARSIKQSTGIQNLDEQNYFNEVAAVPPSTEQTLIADFLVRETAEIDAFIGDQEELISLLTERRAATISHAVTKGLDPLAPMKNSGVEWLGEVPADWEVTKVSTYFKVRLGKMLDAGKARVDSAVNLPYLRAGNLREEGLSLESVNRMPFTAGEISQFSLKKDDLLVVEGGAIGVNVILDNDMHGWGFQKTINRVRPIGESSTRFLGYCLDAVRFSGALDMIANKSTIAHFTAEKLEGLRLAFPLPSVQSSIAMYLDGETAEFDGTIADAREAIALSKERRAALISAAVTGKIDVRQHRLQTHEGVG